VVACHGWRAGREAQQDLATDFNASQSDYVIVPVYKGNYTETLTAAIAAFRAKEPGIVQVFEVGTATMMARQGRGLSGLPADGRQPTSPSIRRTTWRR
jgi:sn-glycerol 3-phosphate transport system substrate-binding protein